MLCFNHLHSGERHWNGHIIKHPIHFCNSLVCFIKESLWTQPNGVDNTSVDIDYEQCMLNKDPSASLSTFRSELLLYFLLLCTLICSFSALHLWLMLKSSACVWVYLQSAAQCLQDGLWFKICLCMQILRNTKQAGTLCWSTQMQKGILAKVICF